MSLSPDRCVLMFSHTVMMITILLWHHHAVLILTWLVSNLYNVSSPLQYFLSKSVRKIGKFQPIQQICLKYICITSELTLLPNNKMLAGLQEIIQIWLVYNVNYCSKFINKPCYCVAPHHRSDSAEDVRAAFSTSQLHQPEPL